MRRFKDAAEPVNSGVASDENCAQPLKDRNVQLNNTSEITLYSIISYVIHVCCLVTEQ